MSEASAVLPTAAACQSARHPSRRHRRHHLRTVCNRNEHAMCVRSLGAAAVYFGFSERLPLLASFHRSFKAQPGLQSPH